MKYQERTAIKTPEDKEFFKKGGYCDQLIQGLPIPAYLCDMDGNIRLFNQAVLQLWGRSPAPDDPRWCGPLALHTPDELPLAPQECPGALAAQGSRFDQDKELLFHGADGTQHRLTMNCRMISSAEGRPMAVISTLTDITSRKANEEREYRLASIIRNSDDAIVGKNLDGIVTSWNLSAQRIFGYSAEEMIGRSILTIIPEDRQNEEPVILDKLRKGQRVDHFETKRIAKNGRLLDVSITISPVMDKEGRIIGVSKIARDITRQKNADRTIEQERARLSMGISLTTLGTWEYTFADKSLNCSTVCKAILGFDPSVNIVSADVIPGFPQAQLEILQKAVLSPINALSPEIFDTSLQYRRPNDDKLRWLRIQGKVFFSEDRKPEYYIGTILDITEERAARELLEQTVKERTHELTNLNQRLTETNLSLQKFAYIASHDLQEPLRKARIFADRASLFLSQGQPDKAEDQLKRIRTGAQRMSELIRDILDYSRLSVSDRPAEPVDLNSVLQEVLQELDQKIAESGAEIFADPLPVYPGIPIEFRQLFSNLIGNALKFSPDRPRVEIRATSIPPEQLPQRLYLQQSNSYLRLEFRDNGIGFDDQFVERIFGIFERLHSSKDYTGSGIGLSICRKIVENHGGAITAQGWQGKGALFTVYLPQP